MPTPTCTITARPNSFQINEFGLRSQPGNTGEDHQLAAAGFVLAEQTDEWAEGCRYLGLDILAKSRLTLVLNTEQEVTEHSSLKLSA